VGKERVVNSGVLCRCSLYITEEYFAFYAPNYIFRGVTIGSSEFFLKMKDIPEYWKIF